jgi:hypothetical protein
VSSRPPEFLIPKRNCLTRWVGSTLVFVENDRPPSDDEWNNFLKILAANRADLPKLRLLVVTSGGAPTAEQRKQLAATLDGAPLLVSSVSDNMKIRFVTATIALFHSHMRTFSTKEFDQAYDHLGLNREERDLVGQAIADMRARVK